MGEWLRALPAEVLAGLLIVALLALLWFEKNWREAVHKHMAEGEIREQRLGSLEGRQKQMSDELKELRKDSLLAWIADAEEKGNKALAAMFRQRLKDIDGSDDGGSA